jgi:long-chain-fatty-acid--[acyl-carrier-protein] ligase
VKKFISSLIATLLKCVLWFRYKITIKGLENLNSETLKKSGGILFLPSHPAIFVDPIVTALSVWPKYPIRPMIVEYMYYLPGVNWLMRFVDALPVPNFGTSSNSLKRKKSEEVTQIVIEDIRKGQNFLIYPAGRCKLTEMESIGGASAVHRIISEVPEANVVLMRVKGLWGSIFSPALYGKTPPLFPTLLHGLKIAFKNLIFFCPRRHIEIELVPAPADFPYGATRLEMNRYLENWYNQPDGLSKPKSPLPGDTLALVSHSFWKNDFPKIYEEDLSKIQEVELAKIPDSVKKKVLEKLSEITETPPTSIKPEMSLASDLGLDSLDTAELVTFLDDQFDISGVPVSELTTVGRVMGVAAGQITFKEETEEEKEENLSNWKRNLKKEHVFLPEGKTIPEVFLRNCERMGNVAACADLVTGVLTYPKLKLRVLLLAEYIKRLPGEYIGVLLPASVGANILVLAIQMAGKVPLMVNWTVGPRHLDSVVKLSNVQVVLTSWGFLDRLDNVELEGIEDLLLMLEDLRREITLVDKIKAFLRSKKSVKSILKTFKLDQLSQDDPAVLLFTSGTESMPKGVPLSHNNILSNLRSACEILEIFNDDILYGILPPFHSFGFTISGLFPMLSQLKVAFSPNPTDGKRLAKGFERWGITIICGAPTFLKGMFRAATPGQLKTMHICVTGAEKAPPELFQMVEELGKGEILLEGYGITECSPILTANEMGKPHRGVGKPLPGIDLLIIHPETEKVLSQGEKGLILARGPNIFAGYLNPGLASPFVTINNVEWYKTGDLGHIDPEGNLFISGRLKRFIKVGGEMVSLAAIEDGLMQAASKKGWKTSSEGPSLAICSKESNGDKPKIFLFSQFDTSVDEVNKSLKELGFTNLVKVSSVTQIDEIPLMGTGKVNYRALEAKYLSKE